MITMIIPDKWGERDTDLAGDGVFGEGENSRINPTLDAEPVTVLFFAFKFAICNTHRQTETETVRVRFGFEPNGIEFGEPKERTEEEGKKQRERTDNSGRRAGEEGGTRLRRALTTSSARRLPYTNTFSVAAIFLGPSLALSSAMNHRHDHGPHLICSFLTEHGLF